MKLTTTMYGLEDGSASLGLFGEPGEDGFTRPPHVQVTVHALHDGTRLEIRAAAIRKALEALEDARAALQAELT